MPNFIEVYPNKLTHSECKTIINYFEENENIIPGLFGKDNYDKSKKDSLDIPQFFSDNDIVSNIVIHKLLSCLTEYKIKHPSIEAISSWRVTNNYNLRKYNPGGGYFLPHAENGSSDSKCVLVWMLYLNTVTDGGHTRFIEYDLNIQPTEGSFVIWPAFWTHFHQGLVSKTQEKYICTGWFDYIA